VVHNFVWLLFNLFYLILDDYELLQHYKMQPERKISGEIRWNAFRDLLRGHIFQMLPLTILTYPLLKFFGFYTDFPLPSISTFIFQFIVINIIEDTGFYWVHRYMHTPWAFKKFHYKHHEYTVPFSLTGEINHPVEFMCNILIPMMTGPFLCGYFQGFHIITYWSWITFRELRGTDAHSGYKLPWHPLRIIDFIYWGPVGHDFHHQVQGRSSNLGGYKTWDWMMGTDKKFYEYLKKLESSRSK